ncbi:MAG: transglutaminase domain-containing protein [Bacteroidota bacterium]|nr:transglutaminase domain-containing protein [Bacteroidota bacterium]
MKKYYLLVCILFIVNTLTFARVGDVLKAFKTPGPMPTGLAFDGKNLWLADAYTDKIYKIDPASGDVISSFDSPGYRPEGLTWDGKYLWHVDAGEKYMYQIDPSTGKALKILESNSPNPRDIAWDGKFIWIVDFKSDQLIKVSPVDGMMVQVVSSPGGEPTGIVFDGKYLWVADRGTDRIYLVNPEDGICLSSIRSYSPFPYGLTWGDNSLWCVDYENKEIYQIEIFSKDIFTRWDEKELSLNFIKEFRNYGPGTVKTLDIYLPIPENRDNQTLLESVKYDPEAAKVIEDAWGQKISHFHFDNLKGYSIVKPGWEVKAKIYAIEYFIYPDKVGTVDDIPADIKQKYLQDGDKYQISDPFIKDLAKKIAGGEKNPYWIARKVYEYLTNNLTYNLKPVGGWNPAPTVLKRGTASCSEYTYSMIALCRSLGVPIRYVGAISLRGDDASYDDVFHRWTEVYLPPYGWIPFDANKGDQETPGGKVMGIGNVDARYIITTENGGGDKYLWFGYNYGFTWTSEGKCRIAEDSYGMWSPLGEKKFKKPVK